VASALTYWLTKQIGSEEVRATFVCGVEGCGGACGMSFVDIKNLDDWTNASQVEECETNGVIGGRHCVPGLPLRGFRLRIACVAALHAPQLGARLMGCVVNDVNMIASEEPNGYWHVDVIEAS